MPTSDQTSLKASAKKMLALILSVAEETDPNQENKELQDSINFFSEASVETTEDGQVLIYTEQPDLPLHKKTLRLTIDLHLESYQEIDQEELDHIIRELDYTFDIPKPLNGEREEIYSIESSCKTEVLS